MKKLLYLLFSLFSVLPFAQAHYLWIESEVPTEARVYFGEFNEGLREKAGGRLDERDTFQGLLDKQDRPGIPLRWLKKTDHFFARFDKTAGWLLVQDLNGEVKDWSKYDIGIVKPMYYARAAIANQVGQIQSKMPLDILPNSEDSHQFQVVFKQQPLAKAKVLVYAPNLWTKELQTDEVGRIKIETLWQGRYVIEVIHKERQAGEFQGKTYEAIRHRATFSHVY